jgi:polyisoprenoid-binding protein YceI
MNTRSTIFTITLLTTALGLSRLAHSADIYKIDPRHTSIVFSVGHAGLSFTYGMFMRSAGGYVIDKEIPANSQFKLEIQADSLFTNDQERDEHLKSPDFFNTKQFPTITFESTSCEKTTTTEGNVEYQLIGTLTMHGVPRQIKFPLQMLADGAGPRGDRRTGFFCQLDLKRSEFGMKNLLEKNIVGDAVSVTISFEGVLDTTARRQ